MRKKQAMYRDILLSTSRGCLEGRIEVTGAILLYGLPPGYGYDCLYGYIISVCVGRLVGACIITV